MTKTIQYIYYSAAGGKVGKSYHLKKKTILLSLSRYENKLLQY